MSLTTQLRRMVDRQIRRFGAGLAVTLRERSTLRSRATGSPTTSLTLSAAASIGATTLTAEAPSLVGSLPAGAVITLGADTYTVAETAESTVSTSSIAIELETALTAAVTAGSTLTISTPYADTTYTAMRSRSDWKNASDNVPDTAKTYRLSAADQTRRPKKGDVLIDSTGNATELVTAVTAAEPGGAASDAIYWTITVGSAK